MIWSRKKRGKLLEEKEGIERGRNYGVRGRFNGLRNWIGGQED